jgi:hypothetical protein
MKDNNGLERGDEGIRKKEGNEGMEGERGEGVEEEIKDERGN